MNYDIIENVRNVLATDNVDIINITKDFRKTLLDYKRVLSGYEMPELRVDYSIDYFPKSSLAVITINDNPRIFVRAIK